MLKNILFIGCGGSGGMTLRFIMDQLVADLKARGAEPKIPLKWQFLHIDSPQGEDDKDTGGFRVVTDYNEADRVVGSYVPLGVTAHYDNVTNNLLTIAQRFATSHPGGVNPAMELASTVPSFPPGSVGQSPVDKLALTPLTDGAGARRLLGRTLFLNKLGDVMKGIRDAKGRMANQAAVTEAQQLSKDLPELSIAQDDGTPTTLVFVFGSMAGGTGSSMLLDVAIAVKAIFGNSNQTAVFGYAPDIFKNLPSGITDDHLGNSLGMVCELISFMSDKNSQAAQNDSALLSALGTQVADGGTDAPINRFYPIGLGQGIDGRVPDQNAKPSSVYRRCGRGVARMVMSATAMNSFIDYTLGNPGQFEVRANENFIGWNSVHYLAAWSGFGYSTLSMGRDRFREYAAQRLSRTAVNTIIDGYVDPSNPALPTQQLTAKVGSQLGVTLDRLELPRFADPDNARIGNRAVAQHWVRETVKPMLPGIAGEFQQDYLAQFPVPGFGSEVKEFEAWRAELAAHDQGQQVSAKLRKMEREVKEQVRRNLVGVMEDFTDKILEVTREAIATYGLEYAHKLLAQVRAEALEPLKDELETLGTIPVKLSIDLAQIKEIKPKGAKVQGLSQAVQDAVQRGVRASLAALVATTSSQLIAQAFASLADNFLTPLTRELNGQLRLLIEAREEDPRSTGVELFHTEYYRNWPTDGPVPERFTQAHNETVITEPKSFPQLYQTQLIHQVTSDGGEPAGAIGWEIAETDFVRHIISGQWPTTGGVAAPADLLTQTQAWRPQALLPEGQQAAQARFELKVKTGQVLGRALKYLDREGSAFKTFISQDIAGYLTDPLADAAETQHRAQDVESKFMHAIDSAQPMIAVNENIATSLHPDIDEVKRSLTFSQVPFIGMELGDQILTRLTGRKDLTPATVANLTEQRGDGQEAAEGIQRIDIFGSYEAFQPVTYSSIFQPIAEAWNAQGADRADLTFARRARSLTGFIPTSDPEREAMITGWLLALFFGLVRFPEPGLPGKAEIYDLESKSWLAFPDPLYYPSGKFHRKFAKIEWLPAVLASYPLAMLNWYTVGDRPVNQVASSPLRAYRALRCLYVREDSTNQFQQAVAEAVISQYIETGELPLAETDRAMPEAETREERHAAI
ncbi:MAG: tubulin-like doman-containing protein, partial [Flaviflexus sp.]|nr:tubulin-like doman-containing protein [Flaviflexus sp.]